MKNSFNEKANKKYDREVFLKEVYAIQAKKEPDRTVREMAMLKQYEDGEWEKQFEYNYDYEDDQI